MVWCAIVPVARKNSGYAYNILIIPQYVYITVVLVYLNLSAIWRSQEAQIELVKQPTKAVPKGNFWALVE